jgi:EAL domain-containing protein (putative c-di-GMP-specific phosphodiesterase class I)
MYVAKGLHDGVTRYDPSQNQYDASQLALVGELRRAIECDELVLHYQPKATLDDGRVEALEALVRWEHPKLGLLGPDRFIPLAERTDLIDKLTDWVLHRALADLAALEVRGERLTVAVNVSARNLGRTDFAAKLQRAVTEAGVPPERLVVEITETALLVDPARAAEVLDELSRFGVAVSLDDFGSGQTSLGYLSTLPVHELKIDQGFVSDMLTNPAHEAIVRSIVDLGHNLALRVVAEGAESQAVLDWLKLTGCDVVQGFFIARPMPFGEFVGWLDARNRAAA